MTGRKSGHVCAVRSCRNKRYNSKKRFFCFPKRIERARMWARKASRKDLLDSIDLHKSHRLCEDHFETTMFTNHLCERLSANAFPTLFPPLEEGAKGIPPDHTYSRPGLVLPVKMEGLENNVGVPVKKEESPTFSSGYA
ncbi:52 kDa repressor of the inhibitor of the protein kinase-like [Cylas formicarius]|uniref:52 kDa repressor of the inhibitor of the protein kinase-like n=1 Tax=Cylas formicarius TaxID=197179 RepID=UPI00295841A9|nr:52 kDa repressor of the inhibitor of the protein kinase-like [Cylas formicarius]